MHEEIILLNDSHEQNFSIEDSERPHRPKIQVVRGVQ